MLGLIKVKCSEVLLWATIEGQVRQALSLFLMRCLINGKSVKRLVVVKHIVTAKSNRPCGSCRVNAFRGALFPFKSGLMNKHIVKHILQGS